MDETHVVKLQSEQVIVQAPMSFSGSAKRLWRLTRRTEHPVGRIALMSLAITLILMVWTLVIMWYAVTIGLLFFFTVPFRLLRRSSRNRKRQDLQHRESLAAMDRIAGTREPSQGP